MAGRRAQRARSQATLAEGCKRTENGPFRASTVVIRLSQSPLSKTLRRSQAFTHFPMPRSGSWSGLADDVRAALRAHLNETGTRVRTAAPTGFTFELCDSAAHAMRLERLIYELLPLATIPCRDRPAKRRPARNGLTATRLGGFG